MDTSRIRLNLLPAFGGVAAGLLLAAAVALVPEAPLDGLAMLVPAAGSSFGAVDRLVPAAASGVAGGAMIWAALYLLFGPGGTFAREGGESGMPVVRFTEDRRDAPPLEPLSVLDLSEAPAIQLPEERPLPGDLDQPLAAFDPAAIPSEPQSPVRTVPSLAPRQTLAPGERISSVELPVRRAEQGAPSIEALFARLDRGAWGELRHAR